jgi:hypothetical protein
MGSIGEVDKGADGAIACFNNPLIDAMSSPLAP